MTKKVISEEDVYCCKECEEELIFFPNDPRYMCPKCHKVMFMDAPKESPLIIKKRIKRIIEHIQ